MNLDYIHAAKVVADFLQEDDSAYEADHNMAFDSGKRIISALQSAGFRLSHQPVNSPPVTPEAGAMEAAKELQSRITSLGRSFQESGCGEDEQPEFDKRVLEMTAQTFTTYAAEQVRAVWCFDMSKAPKDGTLLQLILAHDEEGNGCDGGFENDEYTRVMGFNNGDDDGEDVWKFPGWDWCQDCIIEQGCGEPIAWALMLEAPDDIAVLRARSQGKKE